MKNDKSPSPDSNSILTAADVNAAIDLVNNGSNDPLRIFPALQHFTNQMCDRALVELILGGCEAGLAKRLVSLMYGVGAINALSVRHACLDGFAPDDGDELT